MGNETYDYFNEIERFYAWNTTNLLKPTAIALWHALMHTWGILSYPEWFTIAIKSLSVKTGLEKSAILRARNTLKQAGLIDWKERKGNQSSKYHIVPFGQPIKKPKFSELDSEAQYEAQKKAFIKSINNIDDDLDVDYVLKKLINGSRRGAENVAPSEFTVRLRGILRYYTETTGNQVSWRATNVIHDYLRDGVEEDLIIRAIDASVDAGAGNWVYARKILQNCVAKGITTLEAFEAHEEKREDEKRRNAEKATGAENIRNANGAANTLDAAKGEKTDKAKKSKFSNFQEREGIDFAELQRLESLRIEREMSADVTKG